MRKNNIMGVVFANANEDLLPELTINRSIASVPFGGRYRIIDFALSNLVNAGISKVGVITKENYQSLMDHIGSAKSWDLDRKNGGLYILPPYSNALSRVYDGNIDALRGIRSFLSHSTEQYVVLYNSNSALNIDLSEMIEQHIQSAADITIAYRHGKMPLNHYDLMAFEFDSQKRVKKVRLYENENPECDHSLGILVISRSLLLALIDDAASENKRVLSRDVIMPNVETLVVKGYEFSGFSAVMDGAQSYVEASMNLLKSDVRQDLFNPERPIYTKIKDAMPTRYGVSSSVSNSLVADGCIIEGTVKNSILFRGVHIGKGATVENCIIMQGSQVGAGAELKYVTIDKAAQVGYNRELCGAPSYYIFIKKGSTI